MDDLKNWLNIDTYSSIRADKYNGKYSIQLGKRGNNDTYATWVCPQKWQNGEKTLLKKNGEPVFIPLSIPLGDDKIKAQKVLEGLIFQLKNL